MDSKLTFHFSCKCERASLITSVACIVKIRRCINDVAFTIMQVLQHRNYDAGIVAQCFELTNYDDSIVITTLNVQGRVIAQM